MRKGESEMNNKVIKQEARQRLKGKWGQAALFTLIFTAIYYVIPLMIEINLSGGMDAWIAATDVTNGATASTFVITLVLLPLYLGYLWTFLTVVRTGENIKFSGLLQAFSEISIRKRISY
jgi:uncharacterized membrane protein